MRAIVSIFISSIALVLFFVSYIGFINQNINLNQYPKVSGIVSKKGTILSHHGSDYFYLLLKGSNKKLIVYRSSKHYDDLINKVQVNDSIVVYTKKKH